MSGGIAFLELLIGMPRLVAPRQTIDWLMELDRHAHLMRTFMAVLLILQVLRLRCVAASAAARLRGGAWGCF